MGRDFHPDKTDICITPISSSRVGSVENEGKDINISSHRTLKAMRSALAGIPIVSPHWIKACLKGQRIISPTREFSVRTLPTKIEHLMVRSNDSPVDGPPAWLGVSSYAALFQKQKSDSLIGVLPLENVQVLLCGQWRKGQSALKKSDAQVLLREAGAEILKTPSAVVKVLKGSQLPCSRRVVLLCDDSPTDPGSITDPLVRETKSLLDRVSQRSRVVGSTPVLIVNSSWLFDSISCGRVLDANDFEPASPRASSLWSLCVEK